MPGPFDFMTPPINPDGGPRPRSTPSPNAGGLDVIGLLSSPGMQMSMAALAAGQQGGGGWGSFLNSSAAIAADTEEKRRQEALREAVSGLFGDDPNMAVLAEHMPGAVAQGYAQNELARMSPEHRLDRDALAQSDAHHQDMMDYRYADLDRQGAGGAKPVTLGRGDVLVDPTTGQEIAASPYGYDGQATPPSAYGETIQRELAKDDAAAIAAAFEAASGAQDQLAAIERGEQLIRAGAPTGTAGGARLAAGRAMGGTPLSWFWGVPNTQETEQLDEFNKITADFAMMDTANLKGALSDKELAFIREANPSIDTGGNVNMRALALRKWTLERQVAWADALTQEFGDIGNAQLDAFRLQDFNRRFQDWAEQAMPMPDLDAINRGDGETGGGLQVGDVVDGYRFLGGDPSDRNNWASAG